MLHVLLLFSCFDAILKIIWVGDRSAETTALTTSSSGFLYKRHIRLNYADAPAAIHNGYHDAINTITLHVRISHETHAYASLPLCIKLMFIFISISIFAFCILVLIRLLKALNLHRYLSSRDAALANKTNVENVTDTPCVSVT